MINKRWVALWSVLLVIGICFSCEHEDSVSKSMGQFSLRLSADTTSIMKDLSSGLTKSVASELEDFANIADYTVLVMKEKDTVVHYKRFDQMPASISLAEGAYQLIAKKGEDKPAEFLNPYFEGSTSFTIKEQMNTPLELTCTLANARVTVDYTNDFLEAYDEYTALLSTPFTTADVELPKGETRAVYLQVASGGTQMAVGIKLKKKTETAAKTYWVQTPINLARRQNVHLIFKTDGEALEGIGLDVVLDNELEEVPLDNVLIPPFMWEKFDQPTLTYPIEFNEENKYQVNVQAYYKDDPLIGFCMPAGVGHLYIKYWLDGNDEDYFLADLATDEGVAAAIGRRFSWGAGTEESNQNITGLRETGSIHLNNALRSLESPETEDNYLYHFEVFGEDATGKATPTNTLSFHVTIPKAGDPSITSHLPLNLSIVENENTKAGEIVLFAEGHIDPDNTLLTLTHGTETINYKLLDPDDQETINRIYGVTVESPNAVEAIVKYPETVFAGLDAGEYRLTVTLQDMKGKTYQSKTDVSILTPEFTFLTDDGAAFAYYVMLRTQLNKGNPNKLSFQYKKKDDNSWIDYKPALSEESEQVFTAKLAKLDAKTEYDIAVIYNAGKYGNEKYRQKVTVKTENPDNNIPNAGFEDYSKEIVFDKGSPFGGREVYAFYPYSQGAESPWWNTINRTTTQDRADCSWYYGAYPGTVPTKEEDFTASKHWNTYGGQNLSISSYAGNNAMEIATVGWGKNNWTDLGHNSEYRTAGMLYIGDYDLANHKEVLGKPFYTRPSKVKFYYKFFSYNGETTKAYAQFWDAEGTSVGYGELNILQTTDRYTEGIIPITYTVMKRAVKMTIVFLSTDASSPSTKDIQGDAGAFGGYGDSRHIGSVLTVDEVSLIYE